VPAKTADVKIDALPVRFYCTFPNSSFALVVVVIIIQILRRVGVSFC
jgi:hypothetical protein